jgi:hypothetical protein
MHLNFAFPSQGLRVLVKLQRSTVLASAETESDTMHGSTFISKLLAKRSYVAKHEDQKSQRYYVNVSISIPMVAICL